MLVDELLPRLVEHLRVGVRDERALRRQDGVDLGAVVRHVVDERDLVARDAWCRWSPPLSTPVAPIVPGTHGGAQNVIAGSNSRPFTQWVVSPLASAPGGAPPTEPPPPPAPPLRCRPHPATAGPAGAAAPAPVAPAALLPPLAVATCWPPALPALDGTKPMIKSCSTASATSGAYRRASVLPRHWRSSLDSRRRRPQRPGAASSH